MRKTICYSILIQLIYFWMFKIWSVVLLFRYYYHLQYSSKYTCIFKNRWGEKVTLKELVLFLWNETVLRAMGLYYLERGLKYLNVIDIGTLRVISHLQKYNGPYSLIKWHGSWLTFRYYQPLSAWFWAGHEDPVEDITVAESSCKSDCNTCRVWEQQRQPLHPFSF